MTDFDIVKMLGEHLVKTISVWNETSSGKIGYTLDSKKEVVKLNLHNCGITDLNYVVDLIKNLQNLTILRLSQNKITDLSPLKVLTNLTELYLGTNKISDLSPLKEFRNLTVLSIYRNNISDLSPLKELRNLSVLRLSQNKIKDLGPLRNLQSLKELLLSENKIESALLVY